MKVYHETDAENVQLILKNGLIPGFGNVESSKYAGDCKDIYGVPWPIWVSLSPENGWGDITLEIDTSGLTLFPDIAGLTNYDHLIEDEDDENIYFKNNYDEDDYDIFERVEPGIDHSVMNIQTLLTNEIYANCIIDYTGTAVILQKIEPSKIKIYNKQRYIKYIDDMHFKEFNDSLKRNNKPKEININTDEEDQYTEE